MTAILFTLLLTAAFVSTASSMRKSSTDDWAGEDDEWWNPRAAVLEEVTGRTVEEVCASYMAFFVGSEVQADFKTNCVCTGNVYTTVEVNCRDECEFTHPHGNGHYVYSDRLEKYYDKNDTALFQSVEDRECLEFTKDYYNGIVVCGVNEYFQGHFDITIDGSVCNYQAGYQEMDLNDRCLEGDCSNIFPLTAEYNSCDAKTLEGPLRVYLDDHPLEAGSCPVVSLAPTPDSSVVPSGTPTTSPSGSTSVIPSLLPTETPTGGPSGNPTNEPSAKGSTNPSALPTGAPSITPTSTPSKGSLPTGAPSEIVAVETATPTTMPSASPVGKKGKEPAGKKGKDASTVAPTVVPTLAKKGEEPATVAPSVVPSSNPPFTTRTSAQVSGTSTIHAGWAFALLSVLLVWM